MTEDYSGQNEEMNSQQRLRREVGKALRNAQVEQQKKAMVRQLMDDNAFERLMNIRASNHELYSRLAEMVISLAQAGRLQGKMTEHQFVSILSKLNEKQESKIDFKRK
jgi:programmed cell death protein 5